LPDNLKAIVPPEFYTVVTMNAFAGVPASSQGPFPVILFSHGLSAYRVVNSALCVGLASWGFVVVAADYVERGIVNQVTHPGGSASLQPIYDGAARDQQTTFDALDLVSKANTDQQSPLVGAVDTTKVAAVGHSAGGNTAFNALSDPRIAAAVGWAPVPPNTTPPNKPTMIIGAGNDIIFTPDALSKEYATFAAPKRFVEIGGKAAGHNTFTDVCTVIRQGGGLLEYARKNKLADETLIELGENGCAATDMPPERFWPVVQHFTVAELRNAFGLDPQPIGLDDSITTAFGDIPVEYQHTP
jgi:dienelactone hydrolase